MLAGAPLPVRLSAAAEVAVEFVWAPAGPFTPDTCNPTQNNTRDTITYPQTLATCRLCVCSHEEPICASQQPSGRHPRM
jgi:hypothetical protein